MGVFFGFSLIFSSSISHCSSTLDVLLTNSACEMNPGTTCRVNIFSQASNSTDLYEIRCGPRGANISVVSICLLEELKGANSEGRRYSVSGFCSAFPFVCTLSR